MKLELTEEQTNKVREDQYLEIIVPGGLKLYIEVYDDLSFQYGEIYDPQQQNNNRHKNYCFDRADLNKLIPEKPCDPSYYRNDPICPSCGAYMIYKFECCPKCGQALDWRERE